VFNGPTVEIKYQGDDDIYELDDGVCDDPEDDYEITEANNEILNTQLQQPHPSYADEYHNYQNRKL